MARENTTAEYPELPFRLGDELDGLGRVIRIEQEGPGVYYVAAKDPAGAFRLPGEYYVVRRDSPAIPREAKTYGVPLPQYPMLLCYALDEADNGHRIVRYELYKYRLQHGLPLPEQSALHDTAVYGMELHPEYFGPYPVPLHTPRGNTVRHKRLLNGVYWIETDQCRELLAVCYPIGQGDLPVMVQEWALQTDYDRTRGIHHTLGYLFFAGRHLCVALFELMQLHRELETNGMVDPAALMNAIWRDNPAYAVVYNLEEALGLHDTFGLLMQQVGVEQELVGSTEQMIVYSPEAGVTFLRFQG